ncbi:MAG TPA: sigma-70 family RNA polymerase sigma factor [Vicinamibacterales bacterium]|nr:sigma-70 family RNA polymerase sigma factor [Vicinamibacterales bacterium]
MPASPRFCDADPHAHPASRVNELARDQILPLVYDELRRLARAFLARERSDHTLQATALVHEAYLRLIAQRQVDWTNRAQFVGVAAVMMRRILVNHARDRAADKRGGEAERVSLSLADAVDEAPSVDLIALHDALEALATIDARKSRVVELKFFGGLTIAEIAELMELSPATIEREWSFSRAWLYDALAGGGS